MVYMTKCQVKYFLRGYINCMYYPATYHSDADQKITKKIVNAGVLLEIAVLDHLIITDDGFYSFADDGTL